MTEIQIRSLIAEHEKDYWFNLSRGWGGIEELAETIERLQKMLAEKKTV